MKVLLAITLCFAPLAQAQLANQPPAPLWLTSDYGVELEFTQEGKLLRAILLVAGDDSKEITVNATKLQRSPAQKNRGELANEGLRQRSAPAQSLG